jgi:hypothetical protein
MKISIQLYSVLFFLRSIKKNPLKVIFAIDGIFFLALLTMGCSLSFSKSILGKEAISSSLNKLHLLSKK